MTPLEHHCREALAALPPAAAAEIAEVLPRFERKHGDEPGWAEILNGLSRNGDATVTLDKDTVGVSGSETPAELRETLLQLSPWRKGPFRLFNVEVDAEWRSDMKWRRVQPHISSLDGRQILDVGCGNGYYLFRMLGEGASLALGIDPTRRFLYQFLALRRLMPALQAYVLPLRCEQLPAVHLFDSVFSMGVLYHRRDPLAHLSELHAFLKPGGELILETLIVPGDERSTLVPKDRYAKMANVWFLPSVSALENWLQRVGFKSVSTVDVTVTSTDEQRCTEWMQFQSLADFLDPKDSTLTLEGYPAPTRALLIARR